MKKIFTLFLLFSLGSNLKAQESLKLATSVSPEKFGKTLNAGVGIGYYGYIGHSTSVLHMNYELDVAKRFTSAPFLTYYQFENHYYWGGPKAEYKNYWYRQTNLLLGVKGTYYFDDLLKANPKWDFYLAASLGVAIRKTTWENGYDGNTYVNHGATGVYLDAHIGSEFHMTKTFGLTLDLSTGISTFGLAIHM